jgi:hypothetical protein
MQYPQSGSRKRRRASQLNTTPHALSQDILYTGLPSRSIDFAISKSLSLIFEHEGEDSI